MPPEPAHLPPASRSPWQLLYTAAHRLRRRWYRTRAARLPRPVISVGNLHWGGTGKTPVVEALARHLRDRGLKVAILSRGYRSRGSGVRLVSDGGGPLLGPLVAGDEPVLLAGDLPGVAVVVGGDRHHAGLQAMERIVPPPDVFLLDDGFSHLALARDLDLLLFPAGDPFGGGRLPPSGRLREPLAAVTRADAAVLTGADGGGAELAKALRPLGFDGPGFTSRAVAEPPQAATGGVLPPGAAVVAVAGIARPHRFLDAARARGLEVRRELHFGDHHPYPERSLRRIEQAARAAGAAWVLTTAKDYVKLYGRLDFPLAKLGVRAEPEPALFVWLDRRVDALLKGRSPDR